jgi:hypothetical protein
MHDHLKYPYFVAFYENRVKVGLRNFTEQSPSFLKRGDFTELHRLKNPPQSPFRKGGGRDRAKVDQFLPFITRCTAPGKLLAMTFLYCHIFALYFGKLY